MFSELPFPFSQAYRHYLFWKRKIYRLLGFKGKTAWVSAPECLTHFAGMRHPESPARIRAIEQALRDSGVWRKLQKIRTTEVNDIQLARVHNRSYLLGLENQIPQNGSIKIEEDTYMGRDTLQAARFAAGAAVKAVDLVMRKQAKNAFCAIRPPGHHAFADKAGGFCFINNAAVAAMHAIAEYRLQRVAIVDFDLHHGDGTEGIFCDDERVMVLSSYETPLYPFCDEPFSGKNTHVYRSPLKAGDGSRAFREIVRTQWLPQLAQFQPQLIILSSGFDAHQGDFLGHLKLDENDFEWITKKMMLLANRYANGRIVSVLEGGYDLNSLAISASTHIACLTRASRFF